MSYDIAVWKESRPVTTTAAAATYARLCEGDLGAATPDPAIDRFHEELLGRYPPLADLSDEELDSSPWSCGIDISDRHAIMCMSYSRANEVVAFVQILAAKHELVVFNPQGPSVVFPPSLESIPHLRLQLESGRVIDAPGSEEIAQALRALRLPRNSYAILERTGLDYMQVGLQSSGELIIEFQDGSLDRHYAARQAPLAKVTAAFQAYAANSPAWRSMFSWQRLDLGPV